jgi:hypothetical protein
MMKNPALNFTWFFLNLVGHFLQAPVEVIRQVQRSSASEVVHQFEMIDHYVSTQKRTGIFEGKMPNLVGKF